MYFFSQTLYNKIIPLGKAYNDAADLSGVVDVLPHYKLQLENTKYLLPVDFSFL